MITSAISSAARLSLAPARLAGQMAGALLRGLRGNDSGGTSPARRAASATPARRSRAKAQTKRAATRSPRKQQPKRTAARARPKTEPSAASRRKAARARTQARPEHADRTEPLGDVAIAREVESTIFRDIEADQGQVDVKVAEGVVRLRGEVRTPDLIRELEARAARVPQVRRVENLLRTPAPPPEPETPAAQRVDPASSPGEASEAPTWASGVRSTHSAAVAQRAEAPPAEGTGGARAPRTGRWEERDEPTAAHPEGDESAARHERGQTEFDEDATRRPRDGAPHGPGGS